ncbi:MAG: hypothetical protein ACM31E_07080 [Fibrobacterota bacterium]
MVTIKNKRNTTLNIFAAFLLFFSSEKYASSSFSLIPYSFPLQDTTITQIDAIPQYHIFDILSLCTGINNASSDADHERSDTHFYGRTLFEIQHSAIAGLVLQYRSVVYQHTFARFRLDIKRSNLPAFPA